VREGSFPCFQNDKSAMLVLMFAEGCSNMPRTMSCVATKIMFISWFPKPKIFHSNRKVSINVFLMQQFFFIPNKKQAIYEMVRISKQKVLIELRNILCPRIFSNLVKRRILSLLVNFPLPLYRAIINLIQHIFPDSSAINFMKDKPLRQPYFPDTPYKIFKYFPRSSNVYCFSKGKLKKYNLQSKKWWFKPAPIISINLIDQLGINSDKEADINRDNIVNVYDLAIVGKNYGKTLP